MGPTEPDPGKSEKKKAHRPRTEGLGSIVYISFGYVIRDCL